MSMQQRQNKIYTAEEALRLTLNSSQATLELALARLWRNWPEVLGPELAALVRPLGHRKTTMILGAANSMIMQEFTFLGPEILERTNAFLGKNYFQEVRLELMSGRPGLDCNLLPTPLPQKTSPAPAPLGNLLPCMDPASPVSACYRAYVRHFRPELFESEPT